MNLISEVKRYPVGSVVLGKNKKKYKITDNSGNEGPHPLYKAKELGTGAIKSLNHRDIQLSGRQQIREMVNEAVDEQKLLEHLLEDLTEALTGAIRDLEVVQGLGVTPQDIKKLKGLCINVSQKLDTMGK